MARRMLAEDKSWRPLQVGVSCFEEQLQSHAAQGLKDVLVLAPHVSNRRRTHADSTKLKMTDAVISGTKLACAHASRSPNSASATAIASDTTRLRNPEHVFCKKQKVGR